MSIFTNSISAAKDEADAYINAVLNLLDSKEPLTVLGGLVTELEKLVNGLSDEQLSRPEASEKWSILEVIHHLADSELVWAYRLRMVLAEKQPQITGYDQDRWASQLKYREAKLEVCSARNVSSGKGTAWSRPALRIENYPSSGWNGSAACLERSPGSVRRGRP